MIETRSKAARAARSRIESSGGEFTRDCTAELRGQTVKLCTEMLQTINGTGSVHQKTLNRLVRFNDHFRELNTVFRWERRGQATERRRPLKGNGNR